MNALQILEGAYAKIKGHWAKGYLAGRHNMHDMTYCAAGAIMYYASDNLASDMANEMDELIDQYRLDEPEDKKLEGFRFEYNDHSLNALDDGGREASWLLANAMGFDVEQSEYEEEMMSDDPWDYDGFVDECESHIIGFNDGAPKNQLKVYAAFRKAIKKARQG